MRRRRPAEPEPAPGALATFNAADWYRPDLDPPAPPHFAYRTGEDKWVYHLVKAIKRYQAARDAWESAQ